jgi:purine-nucleoside phosphorylase
MSEEYSKLQETISFIRQKTALVPRLGIVLGTGLGGVIKDIKQDAAIEYEELPHSPVSTVQSHLGNLVLGHFGGVPVAVLQGRFHFYEGYEPRQVAYPIRVLKFLGADSLIITNAAGGLNPRFNPSEIMMITDHINMTGQNPLRGQNDERLGPRFPDMTEPYDNGLRQIAGAVALESGIKLNEGVYVGITGPSMETAAETRFLRMIGADAVGMSTIFEVIAAVHLGLKVLGLSIISNVNLPDAYVPSHIDEIIANVTAAEPDLKKIIEGVIARI